MNTHPEALRRTGGGLSRTLIGADTIMQQLPQKDKREYLARNHGNS